ncbi:MAG: ribbon-helix-helix protein, CopG family [Desulfuromonadales bacterium]
MGKNKENPKYNVVSMRVSDEEKLALYELTRSSSKSISKLMREAIQLYNPLIKT